MSHSKYVKRKTKSPCDDVTNTFQNKMRSYFPVESTKSTYENLRTDKSSMTLLLTTANFSSNNDMSITSLFATKFSRPTLSVVPKQFINKSDDCENIQQPTLSSKLTVLNNIEQIDEFNENMSIKLKHWSTNSDKPLSRSNNPRSIIRASQAQVRRLRANTRERNRMHGLNAALEVLRRHIPAGASLPKLSKVETLRLATNYISILADMLEHHKLTDRLTFVRRLSFGLSQPTVNALAVCLQLSPSLLAPSNSLIFPTEFSV